MYFMTILVSSFQNCGPPLLQHFLLLLPAEWSYSPIFRNTSMSHNMLVSVLPIRRGKWVRYPVWQHTFVSPSAFSRMAVVSYWRKYVHEVLVNRLGGLSLPRKSVVRLTDRPEMTLDVYRGR